jgi:hypothetical protein
LHTQLCERHYEKCPTKNAMKRARARTASPKANPGWRGPLIVSVGR